MNTLTHTDAQIRKAVERFSNGFIFPRTFIREEQTNYPPFDAYEDDNGDYVIEFAVAGFTKNEITVEYDGATITVSGQKEEDEDEREYIRKGIAFRSFSRSWQVSSSFEVQDPILKNGILTIRLKNVKEEAQVLTIKSK